MTSKVKITNTWNFIIIRLKLMKNKNRLRMFRGWVVYKKIKIMIYFYLQNNYLNTVKVNICDVVRCSIGLYNFIPLKSNINPFVSNAPFLYPLKISENQGLSFLHLELLYPLQNCVMHWKKKKIFCHHNLWKTDHSKLSKNEPENIL